MELSDEMIKRIARWHPVHQKGFVKKRAEPPETDQWDGSKIPFWVVGEVGGLSLGLGPIKSGDSTDIISVF